MRQIQPELDSNPFLGPEKWLQGDLFNALVRFSPTPAWIIFQDAIVFANSAALLFFGAVDPKAVLGQPARHFLKNGTLRRWDGEIIPVEINEQLFDFQGGKAQFMSFNPAQPAPEIDLFAQMPVPVCFIDSQCRLLRWNDHFADLKESYPDILAQLAPEIKKVTVSGIGLSDLRLANLERNWLIAMEPVHEAKGSFIGVSTIFQKVSRRHTVEGEIQQLFQAVGDALDFGLWLSDSQGRHTYTNSSFCKTVGMTREQCAGFGWTKALEPSRAPLALATWEECRELGRSWIAEMWLKTSEGTWQPVLTRAVPVRDEAGDVCCWVGFVLDNRAYKLAQEELENANNRLERTNRELEEFAYTAGHDLQEPLRVIRMMNALVKSRIGASDDDVNTYLATTEESADRMASLVRDLLDYARVLQPLEAPPEISDLDEALIVAIQSCRASIEESGAVITSDPLPKLTANVGQIARVFQNLISNSIKYRSAESPRIAIRADARGTEWRISVEDNGRGIEDADHQAIFLPFKRLHGAEIAGSGLGLSVCRKVVEQHGGRIWAESEPGVGSLFCFTLPMD